MSDPVEEPPDQIAGTVELPKWAKNDALDPTWTSTLVRLPPRML